MHPQILRASEGTANIMRSACVPLVKKGLDSKWIDEMEWRQGRLLNLGITSTIILILIMMCISALSWLING